MQYYKWGGKGATTQRTTQTLGKHRNVIRWNDIPCYSPKCYMKL